MTLRLDILEKGLATALFLVASGSVTAATGVIDAYVDDVTITSGNYFGGCAAALSVSPASVLPNCNARWVTFSCAGSWTSQVRAYRMLDQAQLALATNKVVKVFLDDQRTHGDVCFAYRIDVGQ